MILLLFVQEAEQVVIWKAQHVVVRAQVRQVLQDRPPAQVAVMEACMKIRQLLVLVVVDAPGQAAVAIAPRHLPDQLILKLNNSLLRPALQINNNLNNKPKHNLIQQLSVPRLPDVHGQV